jgi:hypothetical protein
MLLTAEEYDLERQTVGINHGMDLGRQPSAGTPKIFSDAVLDAGRVLMSTDYSAVDHLDLSIIPMRDVCHSTRCCPELCR